MQVTHLSLPHLFCVSHLQEKSIVVFYAKWQPHTLNKLMADLDQYPAHSVEEILAVESVGGDDVETYVIDVLQASNLPYIVVYNRKNPIQAGLGWSDIVQHLYVPRMESSTFNNTTWRRFQSETNYIKLLLADSWKSDISTQLENGPDCLMLFISGDRSSVGKSTLCLMLIASIVSLGVAPEHLAYIKPVTQCEAIQPVTQYCQHMGIATIDVSPVVFYQGFTRACLAGETETAQEMLHRIRQVVRGLSQGKRLIVIDGVGYPSVGSICGISNAEVAHFLDAPVLLIGKPGVGDAVDSYNLLAAFFEHHRVRVLGSIFNKLELEGFYSLESCRTAINSYFSQRKSHQMPYGYMPKTSALRGLENLMAPADSTIHLSDTVVDADLLQAWTQVFLQNVDLQRIVFDVWISKIAQNTKSITSSSSHSTTTALYDTHNHNSYAPFALPQSPNRNPSLSAAMNWSNPPSTNTPSLASVSARMGSPVNIPSSFSASSSVSKPTSIESTIDVTSALRLGGNKRSRDEIEALSRAQGAKRQQ